MSRWAKGYANGLALCGGWSTRPGWRNYSYQSLEDMADEIPNLSSVLSAIAVSKAKGKPSTDEDLLYALNLAYKYDTALMYGDRETALTIADILKKNPTAKKHVNFVRRILHSYGSKKAKVKISSAARAAARSAKRDYLLKSPWVGSDPWEGTKLRGSYRGIFPLKPRKKKIAGNVYDVSNLFGKERKPRVWRPPRPFNADLYEPVVRGPTASDSGAFRLSADAAAPVPPAIYDPLEGMEMDVVTDTPLAVVNTPMIDSTPTLTTPLLPRRRPASATPLSLSEVMANID